MSGASVEFNEQLKRNKDRHTTPDVPFEREKYNIELKEQSNFSLLTQSIPGDSPCTDVPPDLDTLQCQMPKY